MKIHPNVADKENAKKLARKVGLNKTKAKTVYSLYKTGAKNTSPRGYSDTMYCGEGNCLVIAVDQHVWIALIGPNTWFKTSPVLSCVKFDGGFKLETENSFYELRTVN
jgi:hypothetical protein